MNNIWHSINPERIKPDDFMAVIEIPKGSKKKYELDKETGHLILDRILYTSTHYPANYGLIPRTYADDRDPLDVLVLCSQVLDPLVEVECFPIGCIRMMDGGDYDDKIIAVLKSDAVYGMMTDIEQVPADIIRRLIHYFSTYKDIPGEHTSRMQFISIYGPEVAKDVILRAMQDYDDYIAKK